ncbi:unnamed protein product [Paramecium primaurelia]|uniref:Tetratricopeptide repeat protein n=1 Tax=Paramecium primaurelia TaxID=5886 RepID=A0A8S1NUC0_PARPR|nr:unnamed protein product [Paramecium primaurelia]
MQQEYNCIDQDTLRRDQQLNGLLAKIRDDVMKGYVVEIKTRAQTYHQLEYNSKQSSRDSSRCNSFIKNPRLNQDQIDKVRDLDEVIISSQRDDNQQIIRLSNSLNQSPPKVKSEIVKPIVLDLHLQSEQTFQSFPSKQDILNHLTNINNQLDDIEINQDTGNFMEFIKILTKIQQELEETIQNNNISNNQQISNAIQMIRTLCLLTKFYKQVADFPHAIKSLKQIKKMFDISDPYLKGKIQIELGKLYFLNQSFNIAQQIFYDALLHYERLQWKSEIAYILLWMAKLNAWTKNHESAKKMVYGAISILKEYLPDDDEQIAEAYIVLGECNYIAKNSEQALEFLMKAISIKLKKYNTYKHISFLEVFNLVGLTYGLVPDIQQSLNYFIQALQCFKYNCVQRAQILNNIAVIYQSMGNIENAQKCQSKAKEIYAKFLPTYHCQMERLLLNQTCLSPQ